MYICVQYPQLTGPCPISSPHICISVNTALYFWFNVILNNLTEDTFGIHASSDRLLNHFHSLMVNLLLHKLLPVRFKLAMPIE